MLDSRLAFTSAVVSFTFIEVLEKPRREVITIKIMIGIEIITIRASSQRIFSRRKNEPKIVAEAWKEALKTYQKKFDYIIFAVFFRNHETDNFKVFNEKFS